MNKAKMFLTKVAEHALVIANCHKAAADGEDFDHKAAMESHANLANECLQMCKALDGDELGKGFASRGSELQPTLVSAIAPDAPPSSLRPVFRVGQRQFGEPTPQIDEQFRKITEVD